MPTYVPKRGDIIALSFIPGVRYVVHAIYQDIIT